MYHLFYADGSASMGVRTLLEEIGAPYTLIPTTIDTDQPRPAEQLAINPNGWVPVLTWDSGHMYECAAITVFLCDRHPEAGLAPGIADPERALFLQTLVYFSSALQTAFQQTYYPERFADRPEDERSALARGNRRLAETWGVVDGQIGDRAWILGDRFSAADIYLYMLTTWLDPEMGHPTLGAFPSVSRVAEAVGQRAAVQRVYGDAA
ncbi:MAG: glutathione S-transferase family protein [Pseudomonadota bacterium]